MDSGSGCSLPLPTTESVLGWSWSHGRLSGASRPPGCSQATCGLPWRGEGALRSPSRQGGRPAEAMSRAWLRALPRLSPAPAPLLLAGTAGPGQSRMRVLGGLPGSRGRCADGAASGRECGRLVTSWCVVRRRVAQLRLGNAVQTLAAGARARPSRARCAEGSRSPGASFSVGPAPSSARTRGAARGLRGSSETRSAASFDLCLAGAFAVARAAVSVLGSTSQCTSRAGEAAGERRPVRQPCTCAPRGVRQLRGSGRRGLESCTAARLAPPSVRSRASVVRRAAGRLHVPPPALAGQLCGCPRGSAAQLAEGARDAGLGGHFAPEPNIAPMTSTSRCAVDGCSGSAPADRSQARPHLSHFDHGRRRHRRHRAHGCPDRRHQGRPGRAVQEDALHAQ